jgi:hypothetical protein
MLTAAIGRLEVEDGRRRRSGKGLIVARPVRHSPLSRMATLVSPSCKC